MLFMKKCDVGSNLILVLSLFHGDLKFFQMSKIIFLSCLRLASKYIHVTSNFYLSILHQ